MRAGTLSASPGNGSFTAGQEITLRGSIGAGGRRTVHLQSNLGRSGDVWRDVAGARTRTTAGGRFTLRVPAHSSHIVYRVVSGSRRTSTWTSDAVHQEVVLTARGSAVAGQPLTLVADTSAMPLLVGRALTLQQRVGASWTSLASSAVGSDGTGSFTVTPSATGPAVYRVRQEDFDQGVGHVGWFPSYPVYVDVRRTARERPSTRVAAPAPEPVLRRSAPHQSTAAGSLRWGKQLYDFDWEFGESLSDRAAVGTRRRGSWTDASDGTGRIAMRNGAMQLSSNSEGAGRAGSQGSLAAMLQGGAAQAYGRWETRLMPMVQAGGSTDYVLKAELIPLADAATGCDARAITLVEARPSTSGITIGARAATGQAWSRTLPVTTNQSFHAYAVDVTPRRITWFVDGKAVGRVTDPAAISGQSMTVRISMQASGTAPMRTTRTLVDWVRSYPAGTGQRTRGGTRLTPGTHTATC
ncbi:glycosyl hydrolase family protein [Nocardioides oleivorans]|uniref:Glycosyl hydrolase family protein n=1 Tax=Nocardioides oleivorans TaxID=273676 RepID=A0A4Q2RYR1_9ACTN|nr:glycoside hydrolase family 16 protein [Nocardioides oleivorans]RYB94420.1 glycosyl hydrolase family protein [Nocardioides oleivorans]